MCGNDVSTIVEPEQGFLSLIESQVASGKVSLNKQKLTMNDVILFRRLQTTRIKELELTNCGLNHEMLEELLKADLTNLTRLSLNSNKIGPIGCRMIASAQTLTNLKSLELNGNKIKDVGIKALASGPFSELEDLSLNDNEITVDGLASLKKLSSISFVSLSGNRLDDSSIKILKEMNSEGLVFLSLSRNRLTQNGLKELMQMGRLEVLLIDRNRIKTPRSQVAAPQELFLFY